MHACTSGLLYSLQKELRVVIYAAAEGSSYNVNDFSPRKEDEASVIWCFMSLQQISISRRGGAEEEEKLRFQGGGRGGKEQKGKTKRMWTGGTGTKRGCKNRRDEKRCSKQITSS